MGQFNFSRADLARRRRGMTRVALAEAMGITTRGLRRIERGDVDPTEASIERFSTVLGFPKEFFFGDDLPEPLPENSSFRSLSTLTACQRDQALASGALALHLSNWIEKRFDLPEPNVHRYRGVDPETCAEAVRREWGLGQKPIANIVHLLELHGIRVFSLAEEAAEVDAFSGWLGSTPYIFLNTKKNAERSRMDAAHELGHLVMHSHGGPQGRVRENEAHAFGAAFLMPAPSVLARVPRNARLGQIVEAKKHWKVSALNLARRSYKLGLMTEWQYRSICIKLAERGRAYEPGGIKHHETSQVLRKVFRTLWEEGVTKREVARELEIPLAELDKSIFGLVPTAVANSTGRPLEPSTSSVRRELALVDPEPDVR